MTKYEIVYTAFSKVPGMPSMPLYDLLLLEAEYNYLLLILDIEAGMATVHFKAHTRGLPGGPVVESLSSRTWVQSLAGELVSYMPQTN